MKTVKPFLSDKVQRSDKITPIENDVVVSDEKEIANILNTFFSNIVSRLNIPEYKTNASKIEQISDPILKIISEYENHPSIQIINNAYKDKLIFVFSQEEREEIINEIRMLNPNKASQRSDIPTKIIKENAEIFTEIIHPCFSHCIETGTFPNCLKNADITPIHKKGSKNLKDNYRPVSKIENIFSIFQCGFRKGFSTQHSLLSLIEKWKENVDKGKAFGALLTDLSKAFDCLSHKLLIAKLHAYGFDYFALKLVNEYLTNRKQRTKVNMSYGSWEEILFGVAQGSILGPLLFNIFLCDLFFELNNIEFASYADDNTPYVSGETIDDVIHHLEITSISLFKWFSNNQMKVNPEKCHFLLSTKALKEMKLDNTTIENSECEKLLGVFIDSDMSFKTHLDNICKKASNKIQALGRVTQYMSLPKKKLLFNSF